MNCARRRRRGGLGRLAPAPGLRGAWRERCGRRFGILVAHAVEQARPGAGEIGVEGLDDASVGVEAMLGGGARPAFGVERGDDAQSAIGRVAIADVGGAAARATRAARLEQATLAGDDRAEVGGALAEAVGEHGAAARGVVEANVLAAGLAICRQRAAHRADAAPGGVVGVAGDALGRGRALGLAGEHADAGERDRVARVLVVVCRGRRPRRSSNSAGRANSG